MKGIENWDWNKALPIDIWYKLVFAGYPNWEISPDGNPICVSLRIVNEIDKSSRNIAIEFDDISQGDFYYRDVTNDNIPFVEPKEVYYSYFYFQLGADAYNFSKKYNGTRLN